MVLAVVTRPSLEVADAGEGEAGEKTAEIAAGTATSETGEMSRHHFEPNAAGNVSHETGVTVEIVFEVAARHHQVGADHHRRHLAEIFETPGRSR